MTKRLTKLGAALALAAAITTGTHARQGAGQAAAEPTVVRWQEGAPGCDRLYDNGAIIKVLASNGLTVSAALWTGFKNRADVKIANGTDHRVDVLPETFTLDVVKPRPKSLPYQDPRQLAKSIQNRLIWANALAQAGAGFDSEEKSTSQSSTSGTLSASGSGGSASGTYSGNTTTTTTSSNHAAEQRARDQKRQNAQTASNTVAYIYSVALKDNTLMPGQAVSGAVFFAREKHDDESVLRIRVGGTVFEFPFYSLKKKAKK